MYQRTRSLLCDNLKVIRSMHPELTKSNSIEQLRHMTKTFGFACSRGLLVPQWRLVCYSFRPLALGAAPPVCWDWRATGPFTL